MNVYKIICSANGAVYIGSTVYAASRRWAEHLYDLRRGDHRNRHLQAIHDKYGKASLEFQVLDIGALPTDRSAAERELRAIEARIIAEHKTAGIRLCNIAMDTAAPMTGRKHSPESLARMSQAQRAKNQAWRESGTRPPVSAETRRKLSAAGLGRQLSAESRAKVTAALKGRHKTAEHIRKLSEAQQGERSAHFGKSKPAAQRALMSAARTDKRILIAFNAAAEIRFDSITAAAKSLGVNKGNVSAAARKPGLTVKGWMFRLESSSK